MHREECGEPAEGSQIVHLQKASATKATFSTGPMIACSTFMASQGVLMAECSSGLLEAMVGKLRRLRRNLVAAFWIALLVSVAYTAILAGNRPSFPRPAPKSDTAAYGERRDDNRGIWERTWNDPIALYTLLLTIFTAALSASTVGLWRQTKRLAKGGEDNSALMHHHFAETHRPWVRISSIELTDFVAVFPHTGFQLRLRAHVVVSGNAPARNVVLHSKFVPSRHANLAKLQAELSQRSKSFTYATVHPGGGMAQVSIFPGQESSDIPASPNIWFERNAYIEKGETLLEPVIIGCVSYEGPTAWHHTGFIRMLVNTKHPKGLLDIAAEQFDLANFCLTTDNWVGDGVID